MLRGFGVRLWLAIALQASLLACGNSSPAAPIAAAASPDFELRLAASTLSVPNGCAGTTLSISTTAAFSGLLALSCEGPQGLRCDLGAVPNLSGAGSAVIGVALSAAPETPNGTHTVTLRGRSARAESSLSLVVSTARAPALVSARAFTITGCAGYVDGFMGPSSHQGFLSVWVGAWQQPGTRGFCEQTLARDDGSFEILVPRGCVGEGEPVHLTAGALQTCVSTPFRLGSAQHVVLFGRRDAC